MGTKGNKKRKLKRQQQEGQPPPPQQQQPPAQGHGGGAASGTQKERPPPQQQQPAQSQPGGARADKQRQRQPSQNQGGEAGAPTQINSTWSDCSPEFRAEADILLCDNKAAKAGAGHLANSIADNYPNSPLARHLAGRVQAEVGDAGQALKHLLRASVLQPNCLSISFSLATLYAEMQEFGLGADECRRALAVLVPCDPALHEVPPSSVLDPSIPAVRLRVALAKDRLWGLLSQITSFPRNVSVVRQFCSNMTKLEMQGFLKINVLDMLTYLGKREPHVIHSFQSALQFCKDTCNWQYWICPQCKNVYSTFDMFWSHVEDKHVTGLEECLLYVPERIAGKEAEFLRSWSLEKQSGNADVETDILSDVMWKLIHLNDMRALSVDVVEKLMQKCNRANKSDAPKRLSEIASLDAQDLHNLANCIQQIQQSPMVWTHEKSCTSEHDDFQIIDHITLQEDTIGLSFADEKAEPSSAAGSVDPDVLFCWLCKSLQEMSQASISHDCVVNGSELLREMERMISSIQELVKLKRSLEDKDEDFFCRKASIDVDMLRVTSGLDYVKKRLATVCAFDYQKIIMPALRAYLNDKLHSHIQQEGVHIVGGDNIKSTDSHYEVNKQQPPPTGKSYAGATAGLDHDKDVQAEFLKFLKEYKCAPTESPFYEGELKAMVHRRSTTFCVYYKHMEGQYDSLGKSICRSYARIASLLNGALKEFIIGQDMVEQCKLVSEKVPTVRICELPELSIQALDVFVHQGANVLIKRVQIYGNPHDTVIVPTDLGRELFLGFLEFVIEKHRSGKSWNGALNIEDLQVKNRRTFEIAKKASERATSKAMANDLTILSKLLFGCFRTTQGRTPVYFDQLEADMCDGLKKLEAYNSDSTISFQNYLLSHLALKSAMARGHLFLDLYRVHQALGREDHIQLRQVLTSSGSSVDWTSLVDNHPMLKKVFRHGVDENGSGKETTTGNKTKKTVASTGKSESKSDSTTRQYELHLEHLLLFIRHVAQHGPDHTKDHNREQQLKSLIETDLIIAKYLPDAALDLIKTLLENYTMREEMFVDAWTHFSNSR